MRAFLKPFLMAAILMTLGTMTASAADPENTVYMDLKDGRVVIELRPDLAPETVKHFKELVRKHFYDGLTFHRVIPGFMAQTGDPLGNGTGGSGHNVPGEFTRKEHFVRGTVGLARAQDPNSGDSQFFIVFDDSTFLDGQYTIFGKVTKGMEYVDLIKKGSKQQNGAIQGAPDKILKLQIAADVKS
jgi:peptidylprolyl isomerase